MKWSYRPAGAKRREMLVCYDEDRENERVLGVEILELINSPNEKKIYIIDKTKATYNTNQTPWHRKNDGYKEATSDNFRKFIELIFIYEIEHLRSS